MSYVVVEGVIGVGKTALTRLLGEQIGLNVGMLRDGEEGPEVQLRVEEGELRIKPVREEHAWEVQLLPKLEQLSKSNPKVISLLGTLLAAPSLEAVEYTLNRLVEQRTKQAQLVADLRLLRKQYKQRMDDTRSQGLKVLRRDDAVWWFLLASYRHPIVHWRHVISGAGHEYERFSYESIAELIADDLGSSDRLAELLRGHYGHLRVDAERRLAAVTAWVLRIKSEGGISVVNQHFKELSSINEIEAFLSGFVQIEVKRALQTLTEMYHPAVRQELIEPSVISSLALMEMGLTTGAANSMEQKQILGQVAEEAGMEAWEINWLLQHHRHALGPRRAWSAKLADIKDQEASREKSKPSS